VENPQLARVRRLRRARLLQADSAARYWQRRRHRIAVVWACRGGRMLDAGCGSSLIVQSLNNVIGTDFNYAKLRFLRRYEIPLVNASAFALPLKDGSFDCVIS
jgi:ubiquinone/menaquinone biosynthesis C-methylase UbiE